MLSIIIEKAIEEGRGIYANIKKSVLFLLSSNFGEIITMFVAILAGLAAPLKAIHILWVNLITDSLPGLALGVDKNDSKLTMRRPPRDPSESLFAEGGLAMTLFYGAVIGLLTLGAFLFVPVRMLLQEGSAITIGAIDKILGDSAILAESQTFAFTVLGISQLFHAIGMRNVEKSVFRNNLMENRFMILAVIIGFVLQIAVTEIPFLVRVFGTYSLHLNEWLILTAVSAVPMVLHELLVPVFQGGELVYDLPSLEQIRTYCLQEQETLWDEVKRFENPHRYYVDLSRKLWEIKQELLHQAADKERDGNKEA